MRAVIDMVHTRDAPATVQADRAIIEKTIQTWGTSYEDLDSTLRDLAQGGIDALQRRRFSLALLALSPLCGTVPLLVLSATVHELMLSATDAETRFRHFAGGGAEIALLSL